MRYKSTKNVLHRSERILEILKCIKLVLDVLDY